MVSPSDESRNAYAEYDHLKPASGNPGQVSGTMATRGPPMYNNGPYQATNTTADTNANRTDHLPASHTHGTGKNEAYQEEHDDYNNTRKPSLFNRIRASALFQRLTRVLQFLSAIISLILFSYRLAKIQRLVHHASQSSGAVEGILAAAVLYTLALMLIRFIAHRRAAASNMLTWLLVALDICFVAAFIAVAVLTSPHHGGDSAACSNKKNGRLNTAITNNERYKTDCNLPWGVFGLAIFST